MTITSFRTFFITPERNLPLMQSLTTNRLAVDLPILDISYKANVARSVLFFLFMYEYRHCVDVPHFVYPLTY